MLGALPLSTLVTQPVRCTRDAARSRAAAGVIGMIGAAAVALRAEVRCDTGDTVPAAAPIRELLFHADGRFSVTWIPFEVYRDYWGTYTQDPRAGRLSLVVEGGNYVPPDMDGDGTFAVVAPRRLVLKDMWLGSEKRRTVPSACAAVFGRE